MALPALGAAHAGAAGGWAGDASDLPGTTAPIVDAAGQPVPGSVAELATVRLGGHDQTVLIRGRDATAPVVLYLAGGPSDIGYARAHMTELADDVVFAIWDQRGTGKSSYAALDPTQRGPSTAPSRTRSSLK